MLSSFSPKWALKALLSILLTVVFVLPSSIPVFAYPQSTELAHMSGVTATTSEVVTGYGPECLIDGIDTAANYWRSGTIQTGQNTSSSATPTEPTVVTPQYAQINFPAQQTFNRIVFSENAARMRTYTISVSDNGVDWVPVKNGKTIRVTTAEQVLTETFEPVTASKVRLTITSVKATVPVAQIQEIYIYSDEVAITGIRDGRWSVFSQVSANVSDADENIQSYSWERSDAATFKSPVAVGTKKDYSFNFYNDLFKYFRCTVTMLDGSVKMSPVIGPVNGNIMNNAVVWGATTIASAADGNLTTETPTNTTPAFRMGTAGFATSLSSCEFNSIIMLLNNSSLTKMAIRGGYIYPTYTTSADALFYNKSVAGNNIIIDFAPQSKGELYFSGTPAGQAFTIKEVLVYPKVNITESSGVLTALYGGWENGAITYTWYRADSANVGSDDWTQIVGADSSSYTLTSDDNGKYIMAKAYIADGKFATSLPYSSIAEANINIGISNGASNVSPDVRNITFTFGSNVDSSTINSNNIKIYKSLDHSAPKGGIYFTQTSGTVSNMKFGTLECNTQYTIEVTNNVLYDNLSSVGAKKWTFTTGGIIAKQSDYGTIPGSYLTGNVEYINDPVRGNVLKLVKPASGTNILTIESLGLTGNFAYQADVKFDYTPDGGNIGRAEQDSTRLIGYPYSANGNNIITTTNNYKLLIKNYDTSTFYNLKIIYKKPGVIYGNFYTNDECINNDFIAQNGFGAEGKNPDTINKLYLAFTQATGGNVYLDNLKVYNIYSPEILNVSTSEVVSTGGSFVVDFSNDMYEPSIEAENAVKLISEDGLSEIPLTCTYDSANRKAVFTYDALKPGINYTLTFGSGVVSADGLSIIGNSKTFSSTGSDFFANDGIALVDAAGAVIDSLQGNTDFILKGKLGNYTGNDKTLYVSIGLFDKYNELKKISFKAINVANDSLVDIAGVSLIGMEPSQGDYLRAFVWSENMTPLIIPALKLQ